MSNWINFVKNFAHENGLTYPEALKVAGPFYHQCYDDQMKCDASAPRWKPARNSPDMNNRMYEAGVLIGAALNEAEVPKGALAALLSGLNANISIK